MKEIWKAVTDHPNYAVSNLGRVRRATDYGWLKAGRLLKPCVGKNGYAHVTLCDADGTHSEPQVHTLVARAFLGPAPPAHVVNHKDLVKTNNRSSNLEWITRSGNDKHAFAHGARRSPAVTHPECLRRGENHPMCKITRVTATLIKERLAAGERIVDVAHSLGLNRATVSAIKLGRSWRQ